jgi:hypothetical protein
MCVGRFHESQQGLSHNPSGLHFNGTMQNSGQYLHDDVFAQSPSPMIQRRTTPSSLGHSSVASRRSSVSQSYANQLELEPVMTEIARTRQELQRQVDEVTAENAQLRSEVARSSH